MATDWIQKIQRCFKSGSVFYTRHAKFEMENEDFGKILDHEVYEAVCNGDSIEEYPDDKPYPSILMHGRTSTGRPLHVICAYDEGDNLTIVVTVYQPNPELWIDYKRRR